MMKSPVMWIVGTGTWLITSLASINIGLEAFAMAFMMPVWMDYVIAFSGLFSLGLMVMTLMCGCMCGSCSMCKKSHNEKDGSFKSGGSSKGDEPFVNEHKM